MKKLGFIGAGNMANALLSGIVSSKLYKKENIYISDPGTEKLDLIKNRYGVSVSTDNNDIVNNCDIIIFAVKPQMAKKVISSLNILKNPSLYISILSGVTLKTLESYLPANSKVVRVMPNTPAIIHSGISAVSAGKNVTGDEIEDALKIFKCVGTAVEVSESYINAISAISGSGPAYFYLILEAMSDAGVRLGLSRELALKFAAETAVGSARMIIETGKHPAELKDMVTSPAGTTIEALYEFEKSGLRAALINGICAAADKADEHSKEY